MKTLFDNISVECSKLVTKTYSTSFSAGIRFLHKDLRNPVYNIYGFVRFADEIVDSFHDFDKKELLDKFSDDTFEAIEKKISLNPILNSFQDTVRKYEIPNELIEQFLSSMRMDLNRVSYDSDELNDYILGSAEVVGLMCLKIFTYEDKSLYEKLKPFAMKLGSAFQKINFLRDLKTDYNELSRSYFPNFNPDNFSDDDKRKIESDIENELITALEGIGKLPVSSRKGVYLAYLYYLKLFKKIKRLPAKEIMKRRIRISNGVKAGLVINLFARKLAGEV
ncbi:MAG TPA: phytoene/squalene synthase family protein [Ignavibacteria bacterium]|nr:phytoene/squalene synthase family protein [Ignavibacteria bacterium]HQY51777.1 phytoene/squalene synthase family protein [Ignavibacteria bacterium]HRA99360.1 phytoene/squalene synthase family protein [Ignavibacteria bacterium]